jgi:hypothetical protein
MAIPVWGAGELMKFVIKTFLYSAKYDYSCCFRKQNNIYDRNSNKNKHIRKDTCTQFTSVTPNICHFNTGECLVTETRCCSMNGYHGEQQRLSWLQTSLTCGTWGTSQIGCPYETLLKAAKTHV